MFDEDTVSRSREDGARRDAEFARLVEKFGDQAPARARDPRTHSGLAIKTAYFPHDVEDIDYSAVGAPGQYPFTRGNLAAQFQLMHWANQPVIGYGLPEHTRERMDMLASQGMVGYFGQRFYNLVYDLVSHEGLDLDHPAARGRIGQCYASAEKMPGSRLSMRGIDCQKSQCFLIT